MEDDQKSKYHDYVVKLKNIKSKVSIAQHCDEIQNQEYLVTKIVETMSQSDKPSFPNLLFDYKMRRNESELFGCLKKAD